MKSFLDNKLSTITDRHFKRTSSKKGNQEIVRNTSGPSIYEVIQAVKEESKERVDDKGLKYALAQLHFFGRKNGYTAPASTVVSTITNSCSKMFPYSRVGSVLTSGMEKLSVKLDTKFLDKVAELVNEQEDYDGVVNKLELADNSMKSIESRKYLSSKINTLKGADTVNNLMYDIEEISNEPSQISESILNNELLKAFNKVTPEKVAEVTKDAEFMQIIDFSSIPYEFESFGVHTAQYQILDTLPEQEYESYLEKMADAGVSVEYSEEHDTFNVTSFNINAEDPPAESKSKDTKKLEYEPAGYKAPSNLKFKKEPPPEGKKKEIQIITKLEGQAKEAFTKIYKRGEQLRKIKDKWVENQANLTAIKNSYEEEKVSAAKELQGYLEFAERAFEKLGVAEETVHALETSEGVVLAAIKQTSKITVPEDPTQQIVSTDAQTILDRLKKMGKISDELVSEVEKQITDENSLVKTIEHITKTMYTWAPSQLDVEKIKGEVKQAGPMDKFMSMLKNAIGGVKKFLGLVDNKVDEFTNEYQELQEILEKY